MKEGGRQGETGHRGEGMQRILPSGQTGSAHRAELLTRGLMGRLNTPSLYSPEGRSSPSLLTLLSCCCCCEVLSLTVRAGAKFGPDISLPAPHEALKIRTAPDALLPSTGRRRLKEKGKLITDARLDFSASVTSVKLRQTSLTFENM